VDPEAETLGYVAAHRPNRVEPEGSSMRLLRAPLVAGTALVLLASPAAASGDQQLATRAVLTQADVPPGFSGGPIEDVGDDPVPPECEGAIAKADEAVDAAPLARSGFQLQSGGYALIQSSVAVLPSAKRAKKAMAAYANRSAATACIEARVTEAFTEPGIDTTVSAGTFTPETDDKGGTKVIDGGDQFLGFAGPIRRTAGGAPQLFEYQIVLAREGRAVAMLTMVAQGSIPRDDAQRMLQTVVTRMGGA
jgi:hypothetical protein